MFLLGSTRVGLRDGEPLRETNCRRFEKNAQERLRASDEKIKITTACAAMLTACGRTQFIHNTPLESYIMMSKSIWPQDAQKGPGSHPPTPARQDAPFRRQGRREIGD